MRATSTERTVVSAARPRNCCSTAFIAGLTLGYNAPAMVTLALSLLLAAEPDFEGRGHSGTIREVAIAARPDTRLRAGVGGLLVFGIANYQPNGGAGLTADLGAVFNDRFSLFAHLEGASAILNFYFAGGVGAEYALNEHLVAGLGVNLMAWTMAHSSGFIGIAFPVRLHYLFGERRDHEAERHGLYLGVELAGAVSVQETYYPPEGHPLPQELGFSGALTVGYAWW